MQFLKEILENRLALTVVALMCVLGLLAHHVASADAAFSHEYLIYAAVADDADTVAYLPTATNNPVRLDLNQTLVQVLQVKMSDAERLSTARHGLELVQELRSEIDAMSPAIEAVEESMADMEKSLSPIGAVFQRGGPQKIIELSHERLAAFKDIQALSYRNNFETQRIFDHVVGDEGRLSSAFVKDLNNEVVATQEGFDRRQSRYADLSRLFEQIQHTYSDFLSITARKAGD